MAKPICTVADCLQPNLARGYCNLHYRRMRHFGSLEKPEQQLSLRCCAEADCLRPHYARGRCIMHYSRLKRAGLGEKRQIKSCSKPDCNLPVLAKDFCQRHYWQNKNTHTAEWKALVAKGRMPTRKNPVSAYSRRKSKAIAQGIFVVTAKDYSHMLAQHRGACAYCHTVFDSVNRPEWDHVIPVYKGGVTSIGNLVPACGHCNRHKAHRLVMEWRFNRVVARPRFV